MFDNNSELRRPFVQETHYHKSLHFSLLDVQSQMLKRDPDTLTSDYTRTMMGFLLFDCRPDRIAMLGLGGGSLAKFCYRELPQSRIDVVEINPHVISLREEFHIPRDNDRFRVHLGDGAHFVKESRNQFNVLLVDAYIRNGIPPRLGTRSFYDSCRVALCDDGVLVSNLYCEDSDAHIGRIRESFGNSVFVVEEPISTNRVVFASSGDFVGRHPIMTSDRPEHLRPAAWALLTPTLGRVASALLADCFA